MKKIMFGIVGVVAVLASANAAETADIKAACQASDKTLWVERNKVCIPRNPCADTSGKYNQYCIHVFDDVYPNTYAGEEKDLVNLYAISHNLDCKARDVEDNIVICYGDDVFAFQFNYIIKDKEENILGLSDMNLYSVANIVCTKILNGERLIESDSKKSMCQNADYDLCKKISVGGFWYNITLTQRLDIFGENVQGRHCDFKVKD